MIWEGEAPAEPKLIRKRRLGRSLALPLPVTRIAMKKKMLTACAAVLAVAAVFVGGAADAPMQSGIDKSNFDTAVKPGTDFFMHVNGDWLKKNPIPPDYTRWGSF